MRKPYIKQQKTYPLKIQVDSKPVKTYTPTKPSPPLNIKVKDSEEYRKLEKEYKELESDSSELEKKVKEMYGENIVWI